MRKNLYVAKSIEDALKRKFKYKDPKKTKFLAGGTNLFRLNGDTFSRLISIQDLGLNKIEETKDGVKIGATVTLQEMVESSLVPPYLKEACKLCKSKTLRNMATLGGNINSSLDTSHLISTLYSSKVRILVAELNSNNKVNKENLPIREFLENQDRFKSCLILGVILPKNDREVCTKTYRRSSQAPSAITVSCGFEKGKGSFRIGVSSSSANFQRLDKIEDLLDSKNFGSKDDLYKMITKAVKVKDDVLGSKSYKKHLVATTVCDILDQKGVL